MKPNTCLVIDTWEGQLEIDEAILKANGVAGMGIRLNDMNGGHHMDQGFVKQWNEAANFVRFPYFVYNPWVDGAANFAWLKANMPSEAKSVAVDIEVIYSGYPADKYAGEVVKFLDLCKPYWKTIVYTAQWFLPYLTSWPSVDYWWAQYPSQAYYFSTVKTWDDLKLALDKLDKPFNQSSIPGTLKMWQFSGDYLTLPGNTRKMDVNIFYGTEAELAAYFGTSVIPEPQPAEVKIQSVKIDNKLVPALLTVSYTIGDVVYVRSIDQRPPVEPQPTAGLYRIKSDTQAGVVPTGTRPYIRNGLPCTVRLQGGKGAVLLSPAWMAYVYAINTGKARNYQFEAPAVLKDAVGWHNQGEDNRVEQVVFGGNVLEVLRIEGDRAYIKTLYNDQAPPAQVFPMDANNPLVQNFSIQYLTRLDTSTDGRYARTLVIANPGEQLYLSVKELVKL